MAKILLSLFCCLLGLSPLFSQSRFSFSGKVTDESGTPLPYASISINEARYGTIANDSGQFRLSLPRGTYQVTVAYLGYSSMQAEIVLDRNLIRNFQLKEEAIYLDEVIISPDGRDPAYTIMRLAINRKKQNERPFPEYQYKAYTKTSFGFREDFSLDSLAAQAEAIFGSQRNKQEEESDSTGLEEALPTNIFYLSENLSDVYVREQEKVKEQILSSRVSGASDQFSFLGNLINRFNPYEDRTVMQGIADRGIVSPLSGNAFFFYDFKLIGTLKEGGQKTYKIRLIPKRAADPVYSGLIYIADSSYAVKELDFTITRTQSLDLLDTLNIRQEYMQVQEKWLPFQSSLSFALDFNLLGLVFPLQGRSLSLLSEYNVAPQFEKGLFGKEVIAISDSALNHSIAYWDSLRPVPLSLEESKDYRIKDSLEQVRNSPAYLDSLSRETRKVNPISFVTGGHTFRNYRKKTSLEVYGLLNGVGFNPMEGWFVQLGAKRTYELEKERRISFEPLLRYGFSNKVFSYQATLDYRGNPRQGERLRLSAGDYPEQISRFTQIDFLLNSGYALAGKVNYLKLYRKQFFELDYGRDVLNGVTFGVNLRHENRSPMENVSDYSFSRRDREYTPNLTFAAHRASIAEVSLRWKPFNRYIRTPNGKINLGSSWPAVEAVYTRALPLLADSSSQYDRLVLSMSHDSHLGLLGVSSWRISAGRFFGTQQVYLPDLFHFKGNQTFVREGGFDEFWLLPYYENSATLPFVEAHLEHAFNGFLFNKIPGLRKLKLKEYLGFHYLIQENRRYYLEMNAGIEFRILRVLPLRFDLNWLLEGDSEARRFYFKIVAPISGGGNGASIQLGG